MYLWLIVIAILVVLWFAMSPRGQRTRQSLALRTPFMPTSNSLREQFRLALNNAVAARGAALNVPNDFSSWLNNLDNKQVDELIHQVEDACGNGKVELEWLLENRAQGDMLRALQDTVVLAAVTQYHARELEPFARLEAYRKNPDARGNQKFGQQVFAKLVSTHNVTIPPNLMLADEKERRAYAHDTIEQSAQNDQDDLINIVRETTQGQVRVTAGPLEGEIICIPNEPQDVPL